MMNRHPIILTICHVHHHPFLEITNSIAQLPKIVNKPLVVHRIC